MGFSLKKLITKDLNPFDGPAKPQPASTAQPQQNPIQHAIGNVSHAIGNTVNAGATTARDTYGATKAIGRFVAKSPTSQEDPVFQALKSVPGGVADWAKAGGRSLYDIGRGAAADLTNNQTALDNAHKAKQTDFSQFLPSRQLAQAAETIVHPFSAHTTTAQSEDDKQLFGTVPIQNIQAGVKSNYDEHANLPLPQRIALASGYGAGQLAQDVLAVAGAKTGGKVLAKEGGAAVKTASKATHDVVTAKPYRQIDDNELAAVNRVAQQRAGFGDAIANVQPNDVAIYRNVQAKLGTNAEDHAAVDKLIGARQTYDTKMGQFREKAASLPIGLSSKAVDDAGNPVSSLTGKPFSTAPAPTTKLVSQSPDVAPVTPPVSTTGLVPKESAALANGTPTLPEHGTKQVSNIDKASRSTRSIIERQGEHGKQLGDMLQGARDKQEIYLGQLQKSMPTVTKLARKGKNALINKDFENFVDATQGNAKPINETVARAVQEWQAVHPSIRDRAVGAGLDVGDLGPNYYPHFIDYDAIFKDKNKYNQSINHLVETNQAATQEEAIALLNHVKDVSRNRQFGNLEAERTVDLPFYDKTPNSFISYLNGSAKRIANTETFGAKDENALALIAKAGQQGHDTEAMKNAFNVAVGAKQYNPTTQKISGNIRKYVTTTRLGLGAMTNVSQNVNTGIVTGHLRTLKSAVKQLDPKTREFVGDTGVISDALLNDLKTQAGYSSFTSKVLGKAVGKVTAPFFGTVEKFNRSVAATAGRDYALRLAQKGDEKTLRSLGVTGDIKGRILNEAQQVQAARKVVEKTQFKVDAQDLPGWADSPGGKLVSQFRTFSYAQGKFFSNEILKPAAKGNVVPLARLMAALPVGYGLYEARRRIDGRPEEENKTKVALQSFGKVGGAGLAFDLYQSLNPVGSKYLPSDRRTSMAVGAVGGPAVGIATQGIGALSDAIQRKKLPVNSKDLDGKVALKGTGDYTDLTPAARFGLSQVPIVGTPIKNRLLPYQTTADTAAEKKKTDIANAVTAATKAEADYKAGRTITPPITLDPDTEVAKLKQDNKDRAVKLKSSLSNTDYAITQLSKVDQQKLVAKGTYTQSKIDGLRNYVTNKKTELGYTDDKSSTSNAYKSSDAEYKALKKDFDKKKFDSTAQRIKAQNTLAKAKVGSTFDKDVRDAYGLSDKDLYQYVSNDPDGTAIMQKIIDYGDALVAAGIETKNKFKDKYGSVTLGKTATAKTGSSSTKGSKSNSAFAAALKSSNSASSSNQRALQSLVKSARLNSSSSKKLSVAKASLRKQTIKKQKAKV